MGTYADCCYCSKRCKSKEESRNRIRRTVERTCLGCHNNFTTRSDSKSTYCGHKCPYLISLKSKSLLNRPRDKGKLIKQEVIQDAVNQ